MLFCSCLGPWIFWLANTLCLSPYLLSSLLFTWCREALAKVIVMADKAVLALLMTIISHWQGGGGCCCNGRSLRGRMGWIIGWFRTTTLSIIPFNWEMMLDVCWRYPEISALWGQFCQICYLVMVGTIDDLMIFGYLIIFLAGSVELWDLCWQD